jgi:hypothetical protein
VTSPVIRAGAPVAARRRQAGAIRLSRRVVNTLHAWPLTHPDIQVAGDPVQLR